MNDQNNSGRILFVASGLICCAVCLFSCNFFTAPDPFTNTEARQTAEAEQGGILNFKAGQHVGGLITITVVPNTPPSESVNEVTLFIDTTLVGSVSAPPYSFVINTAKWPQTSHVIRSFIWTAYNHLGLEASLQGSPSEAFETTLVFDPTLPIAPSNVSVRNSNGHPQLSWSGSAFSNYFCYVIERNGIPVDSLFSRSDSTFLDAAYTLSDFDNVGYNVGASSGGAIAYAPPVSLQYGQSLSFYPASGILDGFSDEVIFEIYPDPSTNINHSTLLAVSTQTHTIISQAEVPSEFNYVGPIAKSLDGERIFDWQRNWNNLFVFDTNLQVITQINVNMAAYDFKFAVGLDDKVYYADPAGVLHVLKEDGTTLGPYHIFSGAVRYMSISQDGNTMLVADQSGIKSCALPGDSAVINFRSPITDEIGLFLPDWSNSRIFISRQSTIFEIWSIQTLKPIGSIQRPAALASVSNISAASANSRFLYAASTVQHNGGTASVLAEYNTATMQQTRLWTFPAVIQTVLVSEQGRYLFACTSSDQWIVDLGGTP